MVLQLVLAVAAIIRGVQYPIVLVFLFNPWVAAAAIVLLFSPVAIAAIFLGQRKHLSAVVVLCIGLLLAVCAQFPEQVLNAGIWRI